MGHLLLLLHNHCGWHRITHGPRIIVIWVIGGRASLHHFRVHHHLSVVVDVVITSRGIRGATDHRIGSTIPGRSSWRCPLQLLHGTLLHASLVVRMASIVIVVVMVRVALLLHLMMILLLLMMMRFNWHGFDGCRLRGRWHWVGM